MISRPSRVRRRARPGAGPRPVKIIVAGGFGVGKTTFVGAVSEITPLTTEAAVTSAGAAADDLRLVENKSTTTVAMDFGRITIDSDVVLYLFGTPGQERFWFMWDDLVKGAIGAVVLADTRRLDDCFPALDYFERLELPFVVGVNCFDGAERHDPGEVREALTIHPGIPVVLCDARVRNSARDTLVKLLEHAILLAGVG